MFYVSSAWGAFVAHPTWDSGPSWHTTCRRVFLLATVSEADGHARSRYGGNGVAEEIEAGYD